MWNAAKDLQEEVFTPIDRLVAANLRKVRTLAASPTFTTQPESPGLPALAWPCQLKTGLSQCPVWAAGAWQLSASPGALFSTACMSEQGLSQMHTTHLHTQCTSTGQFMFRHTIQAHTLAFEEGQTRQSSALTHPLLVAPPASGPAGAGSVQGPAHRAPPLPGLHWLWPRRLGPRVPGQRGYMGIWRWAGVRGDCLSNCGYTWGRECLDNMGTLLGSHGAVFGQDLRGHR